MKTTTIKTSVKNLPQAIRDSLKAETWTKREVNLVVVHDDSHTETAYNTQWDGGTNNAYFTFRFGNDGFNPNNRYERETYTVLPQTARVTLSHFCGQQCKPTVYVRNADLVAFFGVETPAEIAEMPAEVKADWLCDEADKMGGSRAEKKTAKTYREAAALVRLVCGVAV